MIIVVGRTIWGSTSAIWIAANEEGHVTSLNSSIRGNRPYVVKLSTRHDLAIVAIRLRKIRVLAYRKAYGPTEVLCRSRPQGH